ncbi:MAG: TorF family putative porin [Pseudomonadota bacterium]
MKIKQIVACAALVAATAVSAPAFAGATGNVGAYNQYVFRGVDQTSNGAAVQGGLDYSSASGFYIGSWASNTSFAGTEVDAYGGYAGKIGEVGYDIGALYYYYTDVSAINTVEGYLGLSYGLVSAKYFYSPDFFGTDEAGSYLTSSIGFPLSETLKISLNVGYSFGDGVKATFGDDYLDYGATLSKDIGSGFSASFAAIGNDLEGTGLDKGKVVIGIKKSFDL